MFLWIINGIHYWLLCLFKFSTNIFGMFLIIITDQRLWSSRFADRLQQRLFIYCSRSKKKKNCIDDSK